MGFIGALKSGIDDDLFHAAVEGNIELMSRCLQDSVDINSKHGKSLFTPLHAAVIMEYPEAVKLLLEHKADTEISDKYGEHPIHYTIENHDEGILKLLLQGGANSNICDQEGDFLLHRIVPDDNAPMTAVLLEHGASPLLKNRHHQTPRKLAKSLDCGGKCLALLEAAEIEHKDQEKKNEHC